MKEPDFLIVGAQKAGTSALSNMLGQHPLIEMAKGRDELKEIHYFDVDTNYAKGLDWYAQQFEVKPAAQLRGEATPNYLFYPKAMARIAHDLPDVLCIAILRHPVARAISQINMLRNKDGRAIDILSLDASHEVIARGMYLRQLDLLINTFGDERSLILLHDDFVQNPSLVMDRICDFCLSPNTPLSTRPRLPAREHVSGSCRAQSISLRKPINPAFIGFCHMRCGKKFIWLAKG